MLKNEILNDFKWTNTPEKIKTNIISLIFVNGFGGQCTLAQEHRWFLFLLLPLQPVLIFDVVMSCFQCSKCSTWVLHCAVGTFPKLGELPQDQARGPGLSAKKYSIPLGRNASWDPKRILTRPLWSSCPQSNNNRSPLKTKDHLFINRSRSGLQPGGISFSKLQKVARPSITPVYCNLHKGRFVNPGLKNITFCILLRIRHCPLPDMLASLSINARSLVPPAPGMVSVTQRFVVLSQTDNICNSG
ncbi:hypothetical protein AVEN_162893-1 [Araneus ventricosus]|uniref:Uncharacterized protein n=1 Tax=Araneus ventricosus TaxID=182803 RepID=A0A4Y2QK86_ARAVE|nr:hypothetical protein AVEN_162893-1 [Araneus ventricosus]